MSEIIGKGKVITQKSGRKTIIYHKHGQIFKMGLKQNWHGNPTENKWIITAYNDKES